MSNFHRRRLGLLLAVWLAAGAAPAQSSRTGWGATPYHASGATGVTFRVWAPNVTSVYVAGTFNGWSTSATKLTQEQTNGTADGVWSADVAGVASGSQYKYYLNNGGGFYKHDPRARWVTAAGTASGANDIVYDPTAFNWNGDNFTNPPQNDLFVYELHIGTFCTNGAGGFLGATNRLNYLKSLGVSAVEVMPVAEFGNSGSSWGYDPAQPFAVDNTQYGGPAAFKTFVQACHAHGIAVLLDTVLNHFGPSDLDMWNFDGWAGTNSLGGGGIYFYESNTNLQITPWGNTRPNFSSSQVTDFLQDNFTLWLGEYHVDGFRWDAASALLNDNAGAYIPAAGTLLNAINGMIHTNYPGKISIAEDVYNGFGFDSAWDTSYPYAFTPVLTNAIDANRNMATVTNAVLANVRYGGAAGSGRVVFLESHDVVGDLNSGVRLPAAIDAATPGSYRARKLSTLGAAVTLTAPGVPMIFQGQEMLENQSFDSGLPVDWTKTNTYHAIVQCYRDLIGARRNLGGCTAGLEGDRCGILRMDNTAKVVAFDRWNSGATNENVVVVANFAGTTNGNYSLNFPAAGTWYVHFNTDSTNYGSDFSNTGSTVVTASGSPPVAGITIGPYSALILSQTPVAPPQLTITATNRAVNIAWPLTYAGWLLQVCPTLAGNLAWTQVAPAQYHTNATVVYYTANLPGTNTYFRLTSP